MDDINNPSVVGVRFSKVGKVYHFSANNVTDVKIGDMVVVETSRGWQLGQIAQILQDADPPPDGWKQIDRRATPRDLLLRQMWQMKESEVVDSCRVRASELRLNGVKIVSAEYSFDGSRLTILFSTETEEKYDLKSLRQDMQKHYAPSQVDLRQVGPRDVAKVHCGMGACGLETRCCCLFLTEFSSISIKMAKEQGISLTPSEITGMCGRLRCCLIYEYDTYVDARAKLPKRNKRVRTPQGDGKVVDVIPLRDAVVIELPELGHKEFPASEVFVIDENTPPGGGTPPMLPAQKGAEIGVDSNITQSVVRKPDLPDRQPPEAKKSQPNIGRERRSGDQRQRPQRRSGGEDRQDATRKGTESSSDEVKRTPKSGRKGPESSVNQSQSRWKRPENKQQAGGSQGKSNPEMGSEGPIRSSKDIRRRRGHRRDNTDNSTPA